MICYEPETRSANERARQQWPKLVATRCGPGTGDTICTYEERDGRRYERMESMATAGMAVRVNYHCGGGVETVRVAPPAPDLDFRKYWHPPEPPTNPAKSPKVRAGAPSLRVVVRPEFHARSNPRPRS